MKRGRVKHTYKDPVCNMELSPESAVEESSYKGRLYYFCSPYCRERFEAKPEEYVRDAPHGEDDST